MGILKRVCSGRATPASRIAVGGLSIVALALAGSVTAHAKNVALEYQVKAVYLFNFAKFIEWPAEARSGPLTICVAGQNPFGDVLEETLHGEAVNDRPLTMRLIQAPEPGCHIVFVPQGTATAAYVRAVRGTPTLTVGESPDFIAEGGIINFVIEEGKVRFQIDAKAAERAELRISSHLLRLARTVDKRGDQ
jgi:hypothetical protein